MVRWIHASLQCGFRGDGYGSPERDYACLLLRTANRYPAHPGGSPISVNKSVTPALPFVKTISSLEGTV